MDLNTIWFILIAVLFSGFFILEGFDYGVGILVPYLGKNAKERRILIRTIAPFWDGNEVWILTAGGAMFAAFPNWYATLFSGFYPALALMLFALIIRGVALEYHGKHDKPEWRRTWEWMLCAGSLVPAILWGTALSNLLYGVPINSRMEYAGGFVDLLNGHSLVGGVFTLCLFLLQGALFLSLKTKDDLHRRSSILSQQLKWVVLIAGIALFTVALPGPDRYCSLALFLLAVINFFLFRREGPAFIVNCLSCIVLVMKIFLSLYPRVMVSSLNPAWDLTIYNASSSPYTLKVMTVVAAIFLPIVLSYQAWSYWVFRNRVTPETRLDY